MPDLVEAAVKYLHLSIPIKKDLAKEQISSIHLQDLHVSLPKTSSRPLLMGLITTSIRIPKLLKRLKFMTTGIEAEFYLLLPGTSRRIARLVTEGWHESSSGREDGQWKIEARVKDAPVEICDEDGFDDWVQMMMNHEGKEMEVTVEGWSTAGIDVLATSLQVQKLPVTASLNIPGIPKPEQLDPKCQNDMKVVETTESDARFNMTIFFLNPTPYTLNIGYLHVHIFHDNILIREGSISDTTSKPNSRTGALTDIKLQPFITPDSKDAVTSLVTKYICGKKAGLEIRLQDKNIPSMPPLSHILGGTFRVKVVIPKLSPDQASDTILEANEASSQRDQKFLHENENVGSRLPAQGIGN